MSSAYILTPLSREAVTSNCPVMSNRAVAGSPRGEAAAPIFARRSAYPGIDRVLKVASEMVTKYTGIEQMRQLGLKITRGIRRNRDTGLPDMRSADRVANAIYRWMIRNINYVRDPWNVERIQSPDVTIKQKAGDCDDHAILSAALLQSLGIQTGFRIVSRTGRNYDHIYTVFRSPDGWKSFDTTVAKYPGFAFDETLIKKSKHIGNRMPTGMGSPIPTTNQSTRLPGLLKMILVGIFLFPLMGVVASKLAPHEQQLH